MNEERSQSPGSSIQPGENNGHHVEVMLSIPGDIQKVLNTESSVKWRGESAEYLLASLWDLVLHLDFGSSLVWEDLSPAGNSKSKDDVGKCLSKCLAGRTEMTAEEFNQALERSKVLISALLLAVGGKRCDGFRGGVHRYATEFESKFKPERIRDDATMERRWYESLDKVCWHRYQRLAEDEEMAAEKIEYQLKRALAEEASWWMEANVKNDGRT
jgi:fumarate hydratase class II